jgi:hypothetical protein
VDLLEHLAARGLPLAWAATCKDAAALPPCLRQAGAFDHQVGVGVPRAAGRLSRRLWGSSGGPAPGASSSWKSPALRSTPIAPGTPRARPSGPRPAPQVRLPAPGSGGRTKILAASCAQRGIALPREQLEAAAARADGYDASDLALLLERAVHAALARRLAGGRAEAAEAAAAAAGGGGGGMVQLGPQDLDAAFQGFVPAAFWGVQKPSGERAAGGACLPLGHWRAGVVPCWPGLAAARGVPRGCFAACHQRPMRRRSPPAGQGQALEGWQDIGGLGAVVEALQDALVVPNK